MVYPADTRAVGLDQPQAMKDFCKSMVSRLRDAASDIVGGKARQKAADGNEFHFAFVHVDDDAAAEAVVPMHQRVQQSFADSRFRVIGMLDPLQTLEHGGGFIAEGKIVERILQLLENRAAELLAVLKLGVGVIPEHGDLRRVPALV